MKIHRQYLISLLKFFNAFSKSNPSIFDIHKAIKFEYDNKCCRIIGENGNTRLELMAYAESPLSCNYTVYKKDVLDILKTCKDQYIKFIEMDHAVRLCDGPHRVFHCDLEYFIIAEIPKRKEGKLVYYFDSILCRNKMLDLFTYPNSISVDERTAYDLGFRPIDMGSIGPRK